MIGGGQGIQENESNNMKRWMGIKVIDVYRATKELNVYIYIKDLIQIFNFLMLPLFPI